MTPDILATATDCGEFNAELWHVPIETAMLRFGIDSPLQQAAFLAQVSHESDGFRRLEENLNYSATGLRAVFKKYFTAEEAELYARQPERIANRVYARRNGNGDEESGDGWLYRGRGPIQITFKENYKALGPHLGVDLVARPDLLKGVNYGAESAAWFWHSRGLNRLAEEKDYEEITQRINGGMNGWPHRVKLYEQAKKALGIA